MTTQNTLPERLVETIKNLVKAHGEFQAEVEEFQALANRMRGDLDRLVARRERIDDVSLASGSVMRLPRAIQPNAPEPEPAKSSDG